jgi:hypothetical protein
MVVVLERSDRVGGYAQTERLDEYPARRKATLSVCRRTDRQTRYVVPVHLGPTPFGPSNVPEPRPTQDS